MNHEEEELFRRLEADLTTDPTTPTGTPVDATPARFTEPLDVVANPDQDDAEPTGAGPAALLASADDEDEEPEQSVYVDSATSGIVPADPDRAVRRPVIPAWARSKSSLLAAAKRAGAQVGYSVAFHLVRTPWYATRLWAYAPRGLYRLLAGLTAWATDAEGAPMRAYSVRREDAELYLKLTRKRDDRVRLRTLVLALGTIAALVGALVAYVLLGSAELLTLTGGLLLALGAHGRPAGEPLIRRAVNKRVMPRLTSDHVEKALLVLGIGGMGKGEIGFPDPIHRDGPGWRAVVDLPPGITATDVMERRRRLASGLRRPLGTVWPEGDPNEHEGRLVLWVGDKDLAKTDKVAWPLAKTGRHDLFKPVPFGVDPRGRVIALPIIQHNYLFGSAPGQGKTSSVRVMVSGAALDTSCELWLHENKGTGDLDAFEQIAHRFVSGIDDDAIAYAAESLALLREEVQRRAAILKGLPLDICPDKRTTRQIADKNIGLHPLLAVFDEVQNVFAHKKYGKKAGEDAEFVIKLGRALGVVLVLATQRPDKESLPTGVSGNVTIRFCLKVAGQVENDMILGTSAYKNGIRATTFRPEIDAGIGYLVGATALPTVVKTAYLDGPAAQAIADRAHAMRLAAGKITGHAAGERSATEEERGGSVLDDLLAIWPANEPKVWSETLVAALAALRPDAYTGWGPDQLSAVLKPRGIPTVQIGRRVGEGGKLVNRRGVEHARILATVAERDRNRAE
ncbi:hypothetical protein [Streptacidiphilus rugosus]|uniref:hypothetical protein n=1 Tax=Streptacidiphilus rugosus TaxID=405783 RepID=UPI00056A54BB|nr:hypothetical protein [Streptacidiphilus rugosus]